ncbi:hypothetical protein D3C80_1600090 [compost metagenome]
MIEEAVNARDLRYLEQQRQAEGEQDADHPSRPEVITQKHAERYRQQHVKYSLVKRRLTQQHYVGRRGIRSETAAVQYFLNELQRDKLQTASCRRQIVPGCRKRQHDQIEDI